MIGAEELAVWCKCKPGWPKKLVKVNVTYYEFSMSDFINI